MSLCVVGILQIFSQAERFLFKFCAWPLAPPQSINNISTIMYYLSFWVCSQYLGAVLPHCTHLHSQSSLVPNICIALAALLPGSVWDSHCTLDGAWFISIMWFDILIDSWLSLAEPQAQAIDVHFRKEWLSDRRQFSPFNIALLQLEDPVPERFQRPKIPFKGDRSIKLVSGQMMASLGWGAWNASIGDEVFGSLKIEDQEFLEGSVCNGPNLWKGKLEEGIVCGLNYQHKASCVGEPEPKQMKLIN